jgi:acetate kinase
MLGVSGRSADLRELLAREGQDPRPRLAVALFCYRVRKAIGTAMAVLEGLDAVLFTGGIGEHQPVIRARICAGMAWCGLRLDESANAAAHGDGPARISATDATVRAWAIPSDEERIIACDTARSLGG